MKCKSCYKAISKDSNFCKNCGIKINEDVSTDAQNLEMIAREINAYFDGNFYFKGKTGLSILKFIEEIGYNRVKDAMFDAIFREKDGNHVFNSEYFSKICKRKKEYIENPYLNSSDHVFNICKKKFGHENKFFYDKDKLRAIFAKAFRNWYNDKEDIKNIKKDIINDLQKMDDYYDLERYIGQLEDEIEN